MARKPTRKAPAPAASGVARADQYAAGVLDGTIPACRWIKLAAARYQADRTDANPAYRFDEATAERVVKFVELLPHSKGEWAARGEKLRLEPWQCLIIVQTFGVLRQRDGLRRYRQVYAICPRKSGKSALTAGVGLYMLCADNEHGAEVYCGAASEQQAWEIFRPAKIMAEKTPNLLSHFGVQVNARNINVVKNGSRFEPIIGKPGDGSSPSCAILDEYHEHDSPEQRDTMITGQGARQQPILWVITTAGYNLSGPCFDDVLTGRKVLQGTIVDDQRLYFEFTIDDDDDWTTVEALRKANPNIGVSVSEEFLLARQQAAIRNVRDQGPFLTKHLNQWVNAKSAFFNMQSWTGCQDPNFDPADYEGQEAFIGLDLASKNDIAALQVLIPLEAGRYATFGRYYLPEDTITAPGNDHYAAWLRDEATGLRTTDGNMVDFERIYDDLADLRARYRVREIVCDPAQATMLIGKLMAEGAEVVEFQQQARNYSEPMKEVAALIDSRKFVHGDEPNAPMSWMMSNVVAKLDAKDQVFPRKERPENKIDAPVALMMAMARAMLAGPPKKHFLEARGFRVF